MIFDAGRGERKHTPLPDERLVIVPLSDLIETFDQTTLSNEIAKFHCSRNTDVEKFLHTRSIAFEQAGKSRSFLVVTEESLQQHSASIDIVGYFALALKHLILGDDISKTRRKKLNGLFIPENNVVVGYLIGQIAKNDLFKDNVTGRQLLRYALDLIEIAKRSVGGRFVIVECTTEQKLLKYYAENGFELLKIDPEDQMAQLVLFL